MQNRKGPAEAGNDNLNAEGPKGRPRSGSARVPSVLRFFLVVLAVVFTAETAVMFLLPLVEVGPHGHTAIIVDSSFLTILIGPPIWWLIAQRRRAEHALQRSEEHFRSLIENASDIITVLGKDGAISFVSPSSQRVLGYEPGELIGKNVFNFVHPDDLAGTLGSFSQLLQNHGGHQSAEFRFRHADGSWLVLEAIGRNALHDPAAATLIINSRDITERKQAEDALRESEERFRKIFEEGPMGMAVVGTDHRFVKVNEALCKMVGYTEAELTTLTFPEITHQDHVDDNVRAAEQLLRGEIPFYGVDKRYIRKDGQIIWVALTASIVRVRGDQSAYYLAMVQDISERKRMEETLRSSEEHTRRIVETAYDALISLDAGGVITAWNSAAETVFGWPREEAVGRPLSDTIVPPQHRDAHRRGLQRFVATGEGRVLNKRIEITALHRDGHQFPVELAVWAVRSGESWTFHAFVHDVTERKRAEETQQQLNRALEEERNAVRDFNHLLEVRVRDRTQDLRRANLELRERNRQLLDARAQAATDSLTGLGNHRSFQEHVRERMSALEESTPFSLVMLDIDGFKKINDSLGHQAGDEILRSCGHAFIGVVGGESVYRYGGDEFAILLPGCDISGAELIAERLRQSTLDIPAPVTISLGVASYPETATSPEELIYRADAAMYTAKSAGKNRSCRWDRMADMADASPSRRSAPVN